MSTAAFPTTIRVAKDDEFETIGKLHASAFASDTMYNILHGKMDPAVALQSNWIDGARAEVSRGYNTVLVLERTDTGEVIGEAWFYNFTKDNQPLPPSNAYPEGFNKLEDNKMAIPRYKFQQELMEKYSEFLYLQEFCIAPTYQRQGLGQKFMRHVIEVARKQGLNIAITAGAGEPPFYEKLGFQIIGDPIMIGPDNNIEGVTRMVLELFPPKSRFNEGDQKRGTAPPTIIRAARDDEFETIGRLHASALANDITWNILFGKMDPAAALKFVWMDMAKEGVAKGCDTVLVLERTDTGEVVGAAWFWTFGKDNQPTPPSDSYPEGFNKVENDKQAIPRFRFQQELTGKYGSIMYLQEFYIAPAYQLRGFGHKFMLHLIDLAKQDGLNIMLTAAAGKPPFYEKLGFQPVGGPIMIGPDNDIETITKMVLEQFPPETQGAEPNTMQFGTAPPNIIRVARNEEFETIGKLHASAFADAEMSKIIYGKNDTATILEHSWMEGTEAGVAQGHGPILVLERTDTDELIGDAWMIKYSKDHRPAPPSATCSQGVNKAEKDKIEIPLFHFQQELVETFGEFLYLQEICIAPAFQSQGLGKKLMIHLISIAKEQGLNIAIVADAGKPPFYEKFGFKAIGEPIMIGPDNNIEGVTKMVLELFPRKTGFNCGTEARPTAPPTIIRAAKDDEFKTIAKVDALACADNEMYNIVWGKLDPAITSQFKWIEGAKAGVVKGHDTVLVLEKTDNGDILGLAWFWKYSRENPPMPPSDTYPEGFNKVESDKMSFPRYHFEQELMDKWGDFIYIHELAITPGQQLKGLGKKLMLHIIELAKKERLNIMLTAAAGKPPFYEKLGFKTIGDPIMIGPDNTVKTVTKMVLEQFPAGTPASK